MDARPVNVGSFRDISHLGLIAGGGGFPASIAQACKNSDLPLSIAAISGCADSLNLAHFAPLKNFRLGSFGNIGPYFHKQGVSHVVIIGVVPRLGLLDIFPRFTTLQLYFQIVAAQRSLSGLGDDRLLSLIGNYVETKWKLPILGATDLFPKLLVPKGVLGRHQANRQQQADIATGFQVLAGLSSYDIGQAVIVQQGRVMAVEAAEGTAGLIQRSSDLLIKRGSKAVLVKAPKQGQDLRLDRPTIGAETIQQAKEANLGGIAVEALGVQICDLEETIVAADSHKLFLIGSSQA